MKYILGILVLALVGWAAYVQFGTTERSENMDAMESVDSAAADANYNNSRSNRSGVAAPEDDLDSDDDGLDDASAPAAAVNPDTEGSAAAEAAADAAARPEAIRDEDAGLEPVPDTPTVREFTLDSFNYGYSMETLTVAEGDTVTINLTSSDGFHDWVVDEFDAATDTISPGEETSVTFVADQAGTYEFYCSVGSHRARGMVGTLIVE